MSATSSSPRFTVVVSDSTPMGCDLLTHALKHCAHDVIVAGSARSVAELALVVEEARPEVVLVSLELEDGPGTGLTAVRNLHARYPETHCVVLMDNRGHHLLVDAFRAGARGVVFRSETTLHLVESLRSVRAGKVWAGAAEIEQMMNALVTAVPLHMVAANGNELLTERQKSIVALVAEGLSNREIAQQLRLSEHTVKNYLFRIFDKLGVSSRAELIIYALHRNRAA
jgi:DNA-binding NarL/FixJ family response regulator